MITLNSVTIIAIIFVLLVAVRYTVNVVSCVVVTCCTQTLVLNVA